MWLFVWHFRLLFAFHVPLWLTFTFYIYIWPMVWNMDSMMRFINQYLILWQCVRRPCLWLWNQSPCKEGCGTATEYLASRFQRWAETFGWHKMFLRSKYANHDFDSEPQVDSKNYKHPFFDNGMETFFLIRKWRYFKTWFIAIFNKRKKWFSFSSSGMTMNLNFVLFLVILSKFTLLWRPLKQLTVYYSISVD